jgi:hypothetical protein
MRIGTATVTYYDGGAFTRYDDGSSYGAHHHDTPHYHVISHRCGYGDDLARYCFEHEACHHIVGEAFFCGGPSPIIWALAHGTDVGPSFAAIEEAMVMTFQRWLRANERPIIGGVDWDGLKARALALALLGGA